MSTTTEAPTGNLVIDSITVQGRTIQFNENLELEYENTPEVLDAYFAEKTIKEETLADGTYEYTFEKDADTSDKTKRSNVVKEIHTAINAILSPQNKEVRQIDIQSVIDIKATGSKWPIQSHKKDAKLTFNQYKTETKMFYKKITSAPMGYQVYLVAETKNLKDQKVKLKIHEKEDDLKLLKTKDEVLPVLAFAKEEDTTTDTEISDWIEIEVKEKSGKKENGDLFLYKEEHEDKIEVGIKKIQLRPKEDKIKTEGEDVSLSFEGWQEALYIREDETEEGKKAIEEEKKAKTVRDQETDTILTYDDKAQKLTYPAGDIDAPKTAIVGKVIEYILDIDIDDKDYKHKSKATEADKKNIRWSFYIQGEAKTDKESTYIDTKSKAGLYTYAKTEVVDDKIKLTIVFDEALIGKKVQIEPFRGSPDLSTKPDFVRTTTIQKVPDPKISIRDKAHLYLRTQCDNVENTDKTDKEFLKGGGFKLETPGLLFPLRIMPQNYPGNYKTKHYKKYDYTLHERNAATFGYLRKGNRLHAARDLYTDVNESIYAIADGVVIASHSFYMKTDVLVIEHEYEHIKGHNMVVRYGEVDKNTIKFKIGDKVKRGEKIAEIGQLINKDGTNFQQPPGENRGMLHIEFYTGEDKGNPFKQKSIKNSEMLYAVSSKYSTGRSFQRRKDLFDPLNILAKMLKNSQKENFIK